MKVLIVGTYYPEFLDELYGREAGLASLDYDQQLRRLFDQCFGVGDAYSHGLIAAGCEAQEIVCNADALQRRWALEHGLTLKGNVHDQRRQVVAAQITHVRPDVLLVFEWCPLGDAFLAEMKPKIPLVVGQISSPLPENRTFAAYDLMVSSWPPIVECFRKSGKPAEGLRLAFEERILARLEASGPLFPTFGSNSAVSFVGGFATNHTQRVAWLERVIKYVPVDVWGYGLEKTRPDSPIRCHHRGPLWGLSMYEVLRGSRITLNHHAEIDVRGQTANNVAANMRLYEATGVGTCLFTEAKDNLSEMFVPDEEVVTFRDAEECVEKIKGLLANEEQRKRIALAGQERTLRDHTYRVRMGELLAILQQHLHRAGTKRPATSSNARG